ncbi:uncharacterized protein LOC120534352 isoform X2 [Polypterus senegalus]|uniref:uncharacterized protein LOC120534352 isoform X2 n=1 Tax=Polypterus senegalus TaxID=55291 RepID=UPI001966A575|nr:uncharacterized protein LOC120534352 isoform X2 [Polypterus senegalus]
MKYFTTKFGLDATTKSFQEQWPNTKVAWGSRWKMSGECDHKNFTIDKDTYLHCCKCNTEQKKEEPIKPQEYEDISEPSTPMEAQLSEDELKTHISTSINDLLKSIGAEEEQDSDEEKSTSAVNLISQPFPVTQVAPTAVRKPTVLTFEDEFDWDALFESCQFYIDHGKDIHYLVTTIWDLEIHCLDKKQLIHMMKQQ